jgi:hypothetical protein
MSAECKDLHGFRKGACSEDIVMPTINKFAKLDSPFLLSTLRRVLTRPSAGRRKVGGLSLRPFDTSRMGIPTDPDVA